MKKRGLDRIRTDVDGFADHCLATRPRDLKSKNKIPECLEKGILRAKRDLRVYKDGTLRYDMIDLPITHFYPREIGLTLEKAKELGYAEDIDGKELVSSDQLVEIKVQDLIVSERTKEEEAEPPARLVAGRRRAGRGPRARAAAAHAGKHARGGADARVGGGRRNLAGRGRRRVRGARVPRGV